MRTLPRGVMLFIAFLYVTASSPAFGQLCVGDCDDDGQVSISELVRGVRIALGLAPVRTVPHSTPTPTAGWKSVS